jgi:hypothetical protein
MARFGHGVFGPLRHGFQAIASVVAAANKFLQEDGTSAILLEDGSSKLLLEA